MWFEALSGLKINLSKSALLLVGSVENSQSLALELGCNVGSLPTTYLGCLWVRDTTPRGFGTRLMKDLGKG